MTKYVQSSDELSGHLKDQIAFMKLSANSYDNGFEDEAKRLAVIIRVLLHDTSNSTSLLTQLNKKNIRFHDYSLPYNPNNVIPYNGLTMMRLSAAEGASYVAPLNGGPPTRSKTKKLAFNVWWNNMFVIKDKSGNTFSREDLVLNIADTDGGAHIDPKLNADYASLSRFNSLGWKFFRNDIEDDFRNSPVLPSIRQIAHEVLKTLKDEFPELFQSNIKGEAKCPRLK
ncbi:unnamed protein product [marine sediment metagenome]|uniref:Uncharacterized protein n=1 Tax=marine sediment metagenome TaxID=412755 RepID=X0VKZ8_9ZZZZ